MCDFSQKGLACIRRWEMCGQVKVVTKVESEDERLALICTPRSSDGLALYRILQFISLSSSC